MALRAKERSIHVVWRTARRASEAAVNVFALLASARGCNQISTPASQTHTQTPSAGSWLKKTDTRPVTAKNRRSQKKLFWRGSVCVCVCLWGFELVTSCFDVYIVCICIRMQIC